MASIMTDLDRRFHFDSVAPGHARNRGGKLGEC
jgi:hypothetical protein